MKYHNYDELIRNNKKWVAERLKLDKDYFNELSQDQKPPFLFIGCSDSRMPLNTFTQTEPGELFIHRNVANQVVVTDMNILSVLEFAVKNLQVKHIIVCGHYRCGGVAAAYHGNVEGVVGNWVVPIRETYLKHKKELDKLKNQQQEIDKLSELNIIEQVKNICKTSVMSKAFKRKNFPQLHGWVLDIYSGNIKELKLPFEEWQKVGLYPKKALFHSKP